MYLRNGSFDPLFEDKRIFASIMDNQIGFTNTITDESFNGGECNFTIFTSYPTGTADYLKKVSNRITLFGAIYLALVALVPALIFKAINVSLVNVFSATGILIVVSVALEFEQALQSQIMMKNYKGFLK